MENKKRNTLAIVIGVLLLLSMFLLGRCSKECDVIETPIAVVIPGDSGSSDTILNPKPNKPMTGETIVKWKDKVINIKNPINEDLAQEYIDLEKRFSDANLETERLKKYLESIQINSYSLKRENKYFSTINNIKVQGNVLEFQQDWTLKEREVEVSVPKIVKTEFYAGAEVGNTIKLDEFVVKGNLMIRFKKGDQMSISYDTQKRVWTGYAFKF